MPRLLTASPSAVGLAALAACSHPTRGPAVPRADTARAMPLGIPNARFFADGDTNLMIQEGMRALQREMATLRAEGKNPTRTRLPPVYYLAVSGGGDNGAFGAGLLNGWSETGTRPEFKMVTGVSTGALIAPFAFLGPQLRCGAARGLHHHDARQHLPRARHLGRAVRRRHGRHVAACRRHRQVCR